ncbi:MAG: hypothetical protein KDJ29_03055 [Hyphomicrobiales bacterium]|nr:hypothetical protein [Hyphomicrobiales bacterium]
MVIDWGQTIFYGLAAGGFCWAVARASGPGRRLSFRLFLLIAAAAGLAGPVVLDWLADAGRKVAWLPTITGGKIFFGMWAALLILTLFESEGQPRRVPVWAGVLAAVTLALAVPPLLDRISGKYQPMSFVENINGCMKNVRSADGALTIHNTCAFEIVAGLCLPNEKNPSPCAQSRMIRPAESARFDPKGAAFSSLPSNRNGATIVACRPPHRPSRALSAIGRGYDGICLPAG